MSDKLKILVIENEKVYGSMRNNLLNCASQSGTSDIVEIDHLDPPITEPIPNDYDFYLIHTSHVKTRRNLMDKLLDERRPNAIISFRSTLMEPDGDISEMERVEDHMRLKVEPFYALMTERMANWRAGR